MSKDVIALFRDASELSERDRATLAGLLIESLETEQSQTLRKRGATRSNAVSPTLRAGTSRPFPGKNCAGGCSTA